MRKVVIIPARKNQGNNATKKETKKLRVAAYCRVSTDSEDQESSYETQVSHYKEYITNHSGWLLAEIFADDAISGTNTKDTASPTAIQKRMDELQKELIEKATNHQHYDTIADELFRLREQTEEAERHKHRQQEKLEHLKELPDF